MKKRDHLAPWLVSLLCAFLLLGPSCTLIKPITCGTVHPARVLVARWHNVDKSDEEEHNDLPTVMTFIAAPVLIPLNYAYWTTHSTISGLLTGIVSDLNVITGNATVETTVETLFKPLKTNATE